MKAVGTSGPKTEQCPVGTYPGRVFFLCDLGTQTDDFKGTLKIRRKVRLAVELSGAAMEDGRPFALGKDFNMNLGSAPRPGDSAGFVNPLTNLIRAITGKPVPTNKSGNYEFDLEDLIGGVALFQVEHTEKGNAKMASFMPLPKGMKADEAVNPPFVLSLDPSEFKMDHFYALSGYWQKIISESPEGKALNLDKIDPADLERAREAAKEKKASKPSTSSTEDDNDILF